MVVGDSAIEERFLAALGMTAGNLGMTGEVRAESLPE